MGVDGAVNKLVARMSVCLCGALPQWRQEVGGGGGEVTFRCFIRKIVDLLLAIFKSREKGRMYNLGGAC